MGKVKDDSKPLDISTGKAALDNPITPPPLSPKPAKGHRGEAVAKPASFGGEGDPNAAMLARMFEWRANGLWRKAQGDKVPECFVASLFDVVGMTRSTEQGDWGLLLRWKDSDCQTQEWAMPIDALAGDGQAVRSYLLNHGLSLGATRAAKEALNQFLLMSKPKERFRCVDRTGWHTLGSTTVYVMPDQNFGMLPDGESVILQNIRQGDHAFKQAGTLAEWRDEVARYCVGNARLSFATAAAFASVMLELTGLQSGGINYRGASQTGKSTTLRMAGSVWGGGGINGIIQNWRAIANGLESVAAMACDGLLCLDEMGQADPKEIGETAYMLANGTGKTRAGRDGAQRKASQWSTLFLSTGEVNLEQAMAQTGQQTRAGMEVRMIDLPADAGKGWGIFEMLHGFAGPGKLADHLNDAVKKYYGTAIRAFLAALVAEIEQEERHTLQGWFANQEAIFLAAHLPEAASGQVRSVAKRFAMIGAAGELAGRYKITGWPKGEAMRGAEICFKAWLEGRGTAGQFEDRQYLTLLSGFLSQYAESRFETPQGESKFVIQSLAGYRLPDGNAEMMFGVLTEVWKEIFSGHDPKQAAKVIEACGFLKPENGGRRVALVSVGGKKRRLYRIKATILTEANSHAEALAEQQLYDGTALKLENGEAL